jgi:hypothetical protein|tara:strand:- start:129 stop:422 length:294 start_codon:yes stop_codon:yes gene_type:complete
VRLLQTCKVAVVLVLQIKLTVQMSLTQVVAAVKEHTLPVQVFKFRWEDLADLAAAVMEVGKVLHHQLTTQPTTQLLTRVAAVAAVKVMPLAVMVVLV